jgi:hypothetical protein
MRYRLSCCLANIDTDVVTIRFELLVNNGFHFINQRPDRGFLRRGCLEVLRNVTARNYQAMAGVDRVAIVMRKGEFVLDDDLGFTAKDTILVFGHIPDFLAKENKEPVSGFKKPQNRRAFLVRFHLRHETVVFSIKHWDTAKLVNHNVRRIVSRMIKIQNHIFNG